MLHARVAAAFEDVLCADDVGIDIGIRVSAAGTHAGLRCEMNDFVRTLGLEQFRHCAAVGNILAIKREPISALKDCEPRLFEAWVIVAVEVIDADDGFPAIEQARRRVKADEAGGSRDQKFHRADPRRPAFAGGQIRGEQKLKFCSRFSRSAAAVNRRRIIATPCCLGVAATDCK